MTVKEIEKLSVMKQENIQIYEREGLPAPKHLDNGHRDYPEGDEMPQVFHPWRRYLARIFDILTYDMVWSAFLAFVFHVNLVARSNFGNLLDSSIAIVIMLVLEPLWLHLFGTTLGKAIFGIRIKTPDGRHLSYGEGFGRTWGVIGAGMGYNIPIYNIIRLFKSYNLCTENEIQPWDESIAYTLKDTKWYRGLLYMGASVAVLAGLVTIVSAQQLPPNRGNLTVEEFAQNYNYYAKFFDIDFGNEYLDENGRWAEKEFDGGVYIEIGSVEKPEYRFTTENGYLTGVSFTVEIKNNEGWISSYDTQMVMSSLAFASAQKEIKLFSKIPGRIAEHIENNTFKDFHFEEAGITFTSNAEYSGYEDTQSKFLIPTETSIGTYFKLNFSMNKQNSVSY